MGVTAELPVLMLGVLTPLLPRLSAATRNGDACQCPRTSQRQQPTARCARSGTTSGGRCARTSTISVCVCARTRTTSRGRCARTSTISRGRCARTSTISGGAGVHGPVLYRGGRCARATTMSGRRCVRTSTISGSRCKRTGTGEGGSAWRTEEAVLEAVDDRNSSNRYCYSNPPPKLYHGLTKSDQIRSNQRLSKSG